MAMFDSLIPREVIEEIENISNNSEKIFGEMTQEAAKVVENNVRKNLKKSFKIFSQVSFIIPFSTSTL